jgi:hypothetical protein
MDLDYLEQRAEAEKVADALEEIKARAKRLRRL